MSISQTFYDSLAKEYDKLFLNWQETTREQAEILNGLFARWGFGKAARILDCACGIGTQAIGLAELGCSVTASDFSRGALEEARRRAAARGLSLPFVQADFCALGESFPEPFDIVIAMDNALPHMLSHEALASAVESITRQLAEGGIFVASIRDYDALLDAKPPYSPPYIHKTDSGARISFQTWDWEGDIYRLTQYILDDGETLRCSKYTCQYRATRRSELTGLLRSCGCREVSWLFPEETGFYQPILVAQK